MPVQPKLGSSQDIGGSTQPFYWSAGATLSALGAFSSQRWKCVAAPPASHPVIRGILPLPDQSVPSIDGNRGPSKNLSPVFHRFGPLRSFIPKFGPVSAGEPPPLMSVAIYGKSGTQRPCGSSWPLLQMLSPSAKFRLRCSGDQVGGSVWSFRNCRADKQGHASPQR